jgi:hypothetical protein
MTIPHRWYDRDTNTMRRRRINRSGTVMTGADVLLSRVVAGRDVHSWRLGGHMLFEKPFSAGRDPVDVILTLGVARRLTRLLHVGLEMIGEDLEGFWEVEEAEGGARLLLGPSIRLAAPGQRWQFGAAGGPMIQSGASSRQSEASRTLPASATAFAVKASLSYAF